MSTRSPKEGKNFRNEKNWPAFVRHQQWKEKPRMSRWMSTHGRWSSSEVERGAGETSGVNGIFPSLCWPSRFLRNECVHRRGRISEKNIHNEPFVFGRWGPWAVRFRRPTVPPCQHSISRLWLSFTVVQCNWLLWVFPFFGHDVSLLLH